MALTELINISFHINKYLGSIISTYGAVTYLFLFLIIFIETGLVIMPFLPGDSLLFAAGAFVAIGSLNLYLIIILLISAAVLGDSLNYWLGHKFGRNLFTREKSKFFNKEHLIKTEKFYDKYGAKAIVIARFVPIIRTFAPFVAGMGSMKYQKFLFYNIFGGTIWVLIFTLGGFFFGSIPIIQKNFSLVIILIILSSLIPLIIEVIKKKRKTISSQTSQQ